MKKFNSIVLIVSLFITSSFGVNVANAVPKKDNRKKVVVKNSKKKQVNSKKQASKKQANIKKVEDKPVVENKKTNSSFSTPVVSKLKNKKNKRFYTKGRFGAGYGYQYSGSRNISNNQYTEIDHDGIELHDRYLLDKKNTNSSIAISTEYDLYFNLNNKVNPFIGIDAQGRISVSGKAGENYHGYISFYEGGFNRSVDERINVKFNEFFRLAGKFGTKFNVHKSFSLEPYALIGMNVAKIYQQGEHTSYINNDVIDIESYKMSKNKIDIGTVFGAGFGIIVSDKIAVNFEWYRSGNKLSGFNLIKDNRMRMDNFMIKTSYLF